MNDRDRTVMFQLPTVISGELVAIEGTVAGRKFPLTAGTFVIGRKEGCDLHLANEPGVSKVHAKVLAENDSYIIVDEESRNGTIVNGRPVQRETLKDGDEIRVCGCVLRFMRVAELDVMNAALDEPTDDPSMDSLSSSMGSGELSSGALDAIAADAVIEHTTLDSAPISDAPEVTLIAAPVDATMPPQSPGPGEPGELYLDESPPPPPDSPFGETPYTGPETGNWDPPESTASPVPSEPPPSEAFVPPPPRRGGLVMPFVIGFMGVVLLGGAGAAAINIGPLKAAADDDPVEVAIRDETEARDKQGLPGAGEPGEEQPESPENPGTDEPTPDEPATPKADEPKPDEPKPDEPKPDEAEPDEAKPNEAKPVEVDPTPDGVADPVVVDDKTSEPEGPTWFPIERGEAARTVVTARGGGKIRAVSAGEGDAVKRGQVLVTTEGQTNATEIATTRESIKALEAVAESQATAAEYLEEERAKLKRLLRGRSARVTAPVSGTLVSVSVEVGARLTARQEVAVIEAPGPLLANVPKALKVRRGGRATVRGPDGKEKSVKILKVEALGEEQQVTLGAPSGSTEVRF